MDGAWDASEGGEVRTPPPEGPGPPCELRERCEESPGAELETLPESSELGRETDVGPPSLYGCLREEPALLWDREREREREGAATGGGSGGGREGTIGKFEPVSPPGALESQEIGSNVTVFRDPREDRERSVCTFS